MENQQNDGFSTSLEQRKQLLITRGAMYRSGILTSKEKVITGLRVESLAKSAIKQIGLAAFAAWRGGSGVGIVKNLPALATMLAAGVSTLWRQPVWKPLVRGAMVAAGVASVATLLVKSKSKKKQAQQALAKPQSN